MRRPGHRAVVALALAGAILVALVVAGCDRGPRPPRREPDIVGVVEGVTPAADGKSGGSILITATEQGQFTKASVDIRENTSVLRREGDAWVETSFSQLRPGSRVAAWFTGPVAESFPVQVAAEAVVLDY